MSLSYGGSKAQRHSAVRARQSPQARATADGQHGLEEGGAVTPLCAAAGAVSPGSPGMASLDINTSVVDIAVARRRVLFATGDAAGAVYEIVDGSIITSRELGDGRRQVLEILQAGSWIGTPAGETYTYTAETLTACVVRRLDRHAVAQSRTLQMRLHAQLERTLAALQEHALLLGRMTAMERVASFLLTLHRCDPSHRARRRPAARSVLVKTPLKQRDIGDYLGLKVETVSRKMAILKKRMIIATGKRGQFRLLDLEALQRMAAADDLPAAAGIAGT